MAPSATSSRRALESKKRWISQELADKLHRAVTQDYVDYMISDLLNEMNPTASTVADNEQG